MSVTDPFESSMTGRPQIVNDPIRAVRELRRFEFVRTRPHLTADGAIVLVAGDGKATAYSADRPPTRGELVVRDLRMLYEVDMGHHQQYFEFRLPAQGDAFFFQAEVDITWWVEQPELVVRRAIRDVRLRIEPVLRQLMIGRTRQFAIEDAAAAEEAVRQALAEAQIGADAGLQVRCVVRLALDSEALVHFAALRQSEYEGLQAAARHEGARASALHERELIHEKVAHYNELFSRDDNLWALMLIRNPDDIPLVLEGRRADEREAMANKLKFIEQLIDAGHLEAHMIEEPMQMAVETLRGLLGEAANGTTSSRPLYKQQRAAEAAEPQLPSGPDDEG